jgi:hypothetical protein
MIVSDEQEKRSRDSPKPNTMQQTFCTRSRELFQALIMGRNRCHTGMEEVNKIEGDIGLSKIKTTYDKIKAKVGEHLTKYQLRHAVLIIELTSYRDTPTTVPTELPSREY